MYVLLRLQFDDHLPSRFYKRSEPRADTGSVCNGGDAAQVLSVGARLGEAEELHGVGGREAEHCGEWGELVFWVCHMLATEAAACCG